MTTVAVCNEEEPHENARWRGRLLKNDFRNIPAGAFDRRAGLYLPSNSRRFSGPDLNIFTMRSHLFFFVAPHLRSGIFGPRPKELIGAIPIPTMFHLRASIRSGFPSFALAPASAPQNATGEALVNIVKHLSDLIDLKAVFYNYI